MLIAILGLALSSCAGTITPKSTEPALHLPADIAPADSSRFGEASAILRIIDSAYWDYDFKAAPTAQQFQRHLDQYRARHADLWDRATAGVAWARDSAHCAGDVWRPDGDVRWPYFVRFGPPSAWWVTRYEASASGGGLDTVLTFFYRWNKLDTGIVAQAESTSTFPTKLVEGRLPKPEIGRPIYPSIDIVSFPDPPGRAGAFDVWVITSVRGRELTGPTLLSGELRGDIRILDAHKRPVASDSLTHTLGLAGLILSVTANSQDLSIPFHFEQRDLPKGRYTLEVSICGSRNNASGRVKKDFILPSPLAGEGLSDVLLTDLRGPRGEGLTTGVLRNSRNLQGISEPIFGAGDTISPYLEIRIPEGNDWACVFSVFLKPVLKNPVTTVKISRAIPSADSLGRPLVRWAGVDLVKEQRELDLAEPAVHRDLGLIFARVYRPQSNLGVFESSFEVSRRGASGDYWLIIEIECKDSTGRDFTRWVRKKISIIRH